MNDVFLLGAGFVLAGFGGLIFVMGTVELARSLRVSAGLIAATIAAFATSSPELTVSITAAMVGAPRVALGDVLGSNVVNVALVLACAILIAPLRAGRRDALPDFSVAIAAPAVTVALALEGSIDRADGIILLVLFFVWLVGKIHRELQQRDHKASAPHWGLLGRALVNSAFGMLLLVAAGSLIVSGATSIAAANDIDAYVIGATIVAVGTSIPELATVVIARVKGYDDISLGTILGSNIFNGLFILGTAATITPINIAPVEFMPAIAIGIIALLVAFPWRAGTISRAQGVALLAIYGGYIAISFA